MGFSVPSFRNMKFKAENVESSNNSFFYLALHISDVIYRYPSKLATVVAQHPSSSEMHHSTEKADTKCEKFYIYCSIFFSREL